MTNRDLEVVNFDNLRTVDRERRINQRGEKWPLDNQLINNHRIRIESVVADLSDLLSILRCPTVQLPNGMTDSFRNLFGMLGGILQQTSHPHIEQVVRLLFEAYFYGIGPYLHDSGSQKVITAAEQHTEEFLRLVEKHFREPHSLIWYAEQLNIHPKRLSICVHKTTHQTATEWIDRHRLIEACKLLRTSHTPVKQVAALLGFPNQSTFGTWFKRQTGTCPRSFASK